MHSTALPFIPRDLTQAKHQLLRKVLEETLPINASSTSLIICSKGKVFPFVCLSRLFKGRFILSQTL